MADLAEIADIEARLGRELTAAEESRATAYLKDASAAVRKYTMQQFTPTDDYTEILRPTGSFLVLTQTPVTAVTSVSGINEDGTVGSAITGWAFDGIDRINLGAVGFPVGDPWWPWSSGPESFQVVYDFGPEGDAVPDDVIGVVCGMVLRVLLSPSTTENLNSEKIGEYSYAFQQGGGGTAGVTVRLSETDKADLKNYRPQAGSIQVRL